MLFYIVFDIITYCFLGQIMIDFNIANSYRANDEIAKIIAQPRDSRNLQDLDFLLKLKYCLAIYELIKNTPMTSVKVTKLVTNYNDEGLEDGAYFDYETPTIPYVGNIESEDGREFYGMKNDSAYYEYNVTPSQALEMIDYESILGRLNRLGDNMLKEEDSNTTAHSFAHYRLPNDIDEIVLKICGQHYYDKWSPSVNKSEIYSSSHEANNSSKSKNLNIK